MATTKLDELRKNLSEMSDREYDQKLALLKAVRFNEKAGFDLEPNDYLEVIAIPTEKLKEYEEVYRAEENSMYKKLARSRREAYLETINTCRNDDDLYAYLDYANNTINNFASKSNDLDADTDFFTALERLKIESPTVSLTENIETMPYHQILEEKNADVPEQFNEHIDKVTTLHMKNQIALTFLMEERNAAERRQFFTSYLTKLGKNVAQDGISDDDVRKIMSAVDANNLRDAEEFWDTLDACAPHTLNEMNAFILSQNIESDFEARAIIGANGKPINVPLSEDMKDTLRLMKAHTVAVKGGVMTTFNSAIDTVMNSMVMKTLSDQRVQTAMKATFLGVAVAAGAGVPILAVKGVSLAASMFKTKTGQAVMDKFEDKFQDVLVGMGMPSNKVRSFFQEVKRDKEGNIVRDENGQPTIQRKRPITKVLGMVGIFGAVAVSGGLFLAANAEAREAVVGLAGKIFGEDSVGIGYNNGYYGGDFSGLENASSNLYSGTEIGVAKGDSLWKIAEKAIGQQNVAGYTPTSNEIANMVNKIAAENGITDPNKILAGQTLKVPDATGLSRDAITGDTTWMKSVGESLPASTPDYPINSNEIAIDKELLKAIDKGGVKELPSKSIALPENQSLRDGLNSKLRLADKGLDIDETTRLVAEFNGIDPNEPLTGDVKIPKDLLARKPNIEALSEKMESHAELVARYDALDQETKASIQDHRKEIKAGIKANDGTFEFNPQEAKIADLEAKSDSIDRNIERYEKKLELSQYSAGGSDRHAERVLDNLRAEKMDNDLALAEARGLTNSDINLYADAEPVKPSTPDTDFEKAAAEQESKFNKHLAQQQKGFEGFQKDTQPPAQEAQHKTAEQKAPEQQGQQPAKPDFSNKKFQEWLASNGYDANGNEVAKAPETPVQAASAPQQPQQTASTPNNSGSREINYNTNRLDQLSDRDLNQRIEATKAQLKAIEDNKLLNNRGHQLRADLRQLENEMSLRENPSLAQTQQPLKQPEQASNLPQNEIESRMAQRAADNAASTPKQDEAPVRKKGMGVG